MGEFGVRVDHGGFGSRGISLPVGLGVEFGMQAVPPGKEMRMLNAGGGDMKHFGSRRVSSTGVGS